MDYKQTLIKLKDLQERNKGDEVTNDLIELSLQLLAFLGSQSSTELLMRLHQVEKMVGITHDSERASMKTKSREERARESYYQYRAIPNSWNSGT